MLQYKRRNENESIISSAKKIESDFLAFQYNEQIKYLTIDLNEISTKVIQMRKERNELLIQLKTQRNLIDKLIQGY